MSGGFVKEYEDQWLHEIVPTMTALIRFLTMESNRIPIRERKNYPHSTTHREVHEMSNGLSYSLNDQGSWCMLH